MEPFPFRRGDVVRDTTSGNGARHLLEVIDLLGQGAYAVVYKVKDAKTGTLFALKCLSKTGLSWDQLELQREEAKLHKSLGAHRNLVQLNRYFENKDWLFLVLEYCPGSDLFTWITEHRDERDERGRLRSPLERRRIVRDVFAQALEAIAYIHSRGVFHRDIKSENLMIGEDGVVKLTDFGLATKENRSTEFDCGSKPYMSPECRERHSIGYYSPRQADTWSLGILLLTLLYRKTPWPEATKICPEYAAYLAAPDAFLTESFGCEPALASFLSRRVFCPASQGRVGVAEWLRMLYDGLVLPVKTSALTDPLRMERRSDGAQHAMTNSVQQLASSDETPTSSLAKTPGHERRTNPPARLVDFSRGRLGRLLANDPDEKDVIDSISADVAAMAQSAPADRGQTRAYLTPAAKNELRAHLEQYITTGINANVQSTPTTPKPAVNPEPRLRRKISWSDDDDAMDFSNPPTFEDAGTAKVGPSPLATAIASGVKTLSASLKSPLGISHPPAPLSSSKKDGSLHNITRRRLSVKEELVHANGRSSETSPRSSYDSDTSGNEQISRDGLPFRPSVVKHADVNRLNSKTPKIIAAATSSNVTSLMPTWASPVAMKTNTTVSKAHNNKSNTSRVTGNGAKKQLFDEDLVFEMEHLGFSD